MPPIAMGAANTIFILNPVSGFFKFRRKKVERVIKRYLQKKKIDGEIRYSQYAGHTSEIVKEAVAEGVKQIIVSGGDGSINEAASQLIYSEVVLGIIPSGSGNGLAHCLHLPFNIRKAIKVIIDNQTRYCDVLKINDQYAFSIVGVGLDARIAKRYKSMKMRGLISYCLAAFAEYFNENKEKLVLETGGESFELETVMTVFANSNQFGYNFKIAPQANLFDGRVDIMAIEKMPFHTIPVSFCKIVSGKATQLSHTHVLKVPEIEVHCDKEILLNIDGDPVLFPDTLSIKVLQGALKIITKRQ